MALAELARNPGFSLSYISTAKVTIAPQEHEIEKPT